MVQVVGNGIKAVDPRIAVNLVWKALAGSTTFLTQGEIALRARVSEAQVGAALVELEKQGRVTPVQLGSDQARRYKLLPGDNARDHEPDSGSKQPEVALTDSTVWDALKLATGPLTVAEIAGKRRMPEAVVKEQLDALVSQELVTPAKLGSNSETYYRLLPRYDHDAPAGDLKK